jgi:hypothetical protein
VLWTTPSSHRSGFKVSARRHRPHSQANFLISLRPMHGQQDVAATAVSRHEEAESSSAAPSPPPSRSPALALSNPLKALDAKFYGQTQIPLYPPLRVQSDSVDFNKMSVSLKAQSWPVLLSPITQDHVSDDVSLPLAIARDTESHILPPNSTNNPENDAIGQSSKASITSSRSNPAEISTRSDTANSKPGSLKPGSRKVAHVMVPRSQRRDAAKVQR